MREDGRHDMKSRVIIAASFFITMRPSEGLASRTSSNSLRVVGRVDRVNDSGLR